MESGDLQSESFLEGLVKFADTNLLRKQFEYDVAVAAHGRAGTYLHYCKGRLEEAKDYKQVIQDQYDRHKPNPGPCAD